MREQIIRELGNLVEERTGNKVMVSTVKENNGVEKTGMSVKYNDSNVGAVIYIDEMLQQITAGIITEEDAANEIIKISEEHKEDGTMFKGVANISRDYILDNAECRVINKEMNKGILQEVPHEEFLDLAVVYYCVLRSDTEGKASFLIKNDMIERYEISLQELKDAAVENTEKHNFKIVSMADIMSKISGCEKEDVEREMGDNQMYVITNDMMMHGATAMIFNNLFKEMGERLNDNLFILPSSIHEVIVIPQGIGNAEVYKRMVREVNATQVDKEERLSNSVYVYHTDDNKICIA